MRDIVTLYWQVLVDFETPSNQKYVAKEDECQYGFANHVYRIVHQYLGNM